MPLVGARGSALRLDYTFEVKAAKALKAAEVARAVMGGRLTVCKAERLAESTC